MQNGDQVLLWTFKRPIWSTTEGDGHECGWPNHSSSMPVLFSITFVKVIGNSYLTKLLLQLSSMTETSSHQHSTTIYEQQWNWGKTSEKCVYQVSWTPEWFCYFFYFILEDNATKCCLSFTMTFFWLAMKSITIIKNCDCYNILHTLYTQVKN